MNKKKGKLSEKIKSHKIVSAIVVIAVIVIVVTVAVKVIGAVYPDVSYNITKHDIINQIESAEQTMEDDNIKPIPKEDMTEEELAKKSSERF